ncbi:hypothetical protein ACT3SZ_15585 [Corynebacterium sp. AOP40-9SA-29]|uniref:hypothetical protein n=1 Tax=Corynebacterium sp. AOP40-9SA-29 TaxID=3457677 RepID=UPI004033A527
MTRNFTDSEKVMRALVNHPAPGRHRQPDRAGWIGSASEGGFAVIIALVIGFIIATAVTVQAWRTWGWVGLTGSAAIIILLALAIWDRR